MDDEPATDDYEYFYFEEHRSMGSKQNKPPHPRAFFASSSTTSSPHHRQPATSSSTSFLKRFQLSAPSSKNERNAEETAAAVRMPKRYHQTKYGLKRNESFGTLDTISMATTSFMGAEEEESSSFASTPYHHYHDVRDDVDSQTMTEVAGNKSPAEARRRTKNHISDAAFRRKISGVEETKSIDPEEDFDNDSGIVHDGFHGDDDRDRAYRTLIRMRPSNYDSVAAADSDRDGPDELVEEACQEESCKCFEPPQSYFATTFCQTPATLDNSISEADAKTESPSSTKPPKQQRENYKNILSKHNEKILMAQYMLTC